MSGSIKAASESSSEVVKGVVLTLSPSKINRDIAELFGEDARPYVVNRALIDALAAAEFEYKAIWAAKLPQTNSTWDSIRVAACKYVDVPTLEHWAYVARGTMPGKKGKVQIVYFIAQFNAKSYIPTAEELRQEREEGKKKYNFHANLVIRNKRHVALSLCTTQEKTNVWVYLPVADEDGNLSFDESVSKQRKVDILRHPGGELVDQDDSFDPSLWVKMNNTLDIEELNEKIYETECVGKEYNALENNCQIFAKSLFRIT